MKVYKKFIISLMAAIVFLVACLLLYPQCKLIETTYEFTIWAYIFLLFACPGLLSSIGAAVGSFFCMKASVLIQKICRWLCIALFIGYSILGVIFIASSFSLLEIRKIIMWAAYHPAVFAIPGFLLSATLSSEDSYIQL